MTRCLALAAALAAASCGPSPAPKLPPKYDPYAAARFLDDAPQNKKVSDDELALSFTGHDGKPVDLKSYRGKKPVVLVVTRGIPESPGGVFCPLCVAQVTSLAYSRAEFEKRDVAVLVVFPGPAERVGEFMRQTAAGKGDFPFPLLLDKDVAVITKLGLGGGDLAKPSTFIIDKDGHVVYAFVGATSTDRPSLKAILGQLDRLPGKK